jgi:hypothetical protein
VARVAREEREVRRRTARRTSAALVLARGRSGVFASLLGAPAAPGIDRLTQIGAFELDETRERFSAAIGDYFIRWIDALRSALMRAGCPEGEAQTLAEEGVAGIQGALVLSRALDDRMVFTRSLDTLAKRFDSVMR